MNFLYFIYRYFIWQEAESVFQPFTGTPEKEGELQLLTLWLVYDVIQQIVYLR